MKTIKKAVSSHCHTVGIIRAMLRSARYAREKTRRKPWISHLAAF
jgi:hypothetical protein